MCFLRSIEQLIARDVRTDYTKQSAVSRARFFLNIRRIKVSRPPGVLNLPQIARQVDHCLSREAVHTLSPPSPCNFYNCH